jgi:hypothetical protein
MASATEEESTGDLKEMEVAAGQNITRACELLIQQAPAFMIFNGVRVEARGGETRGDLLEAWSEGCVRLRAQLDEQMQARTSQARAAADSDFGPAMRAEVFARLRDLMNAADCYNEAIESGSTREISDAVCLGLEAMCQFARAKKRLQAP